MDIESLHSSYDFICKTRIETLSADLIELVHKRSGARIIFLDREDDNKTFAIAFGTPPEDSTGVFHILEHCVLAGSEKYPVKDPLTELQKSTLYTYLNALTYPDKTVYPVSSKNDKAFLDLISVYMDAVLHPLVLRNKSIFLSEGHRIELDENGEPSINGVVYNEMSGAYTSTDELSEHFIPQLLFKGGTYSYDSGGWPPDIPSLTYEKFKKTHERYYHPSNATVFLDGRVQLDGVLSLLDSYFCEYGKKDSEAVITLGDVDTEPLTEYYLLEDEDAKDRIKLTVAYRGFDHSRHVDNLALNCLTESIADSNSSPFKKPILDSGLCENVHLYYSSSAKVGALYAEFINVKDGCVEELIALFDKTLSEILSSGINRTSLEGVINVTEFKAREADFGSFPRGMVYMSSAVEYALLGEDPAAVFDYGVQFATLREKLKTDYYEKLFGEILGNKRATLIMKPKSELPAVNVCKLDKEKVERETEEMNAWISTPDSDEALATIPTLSLEDIGPNKPPFKKHVSVKEGATVIKRDADTSGISYVNLFFDISDISPEELPLIRLLTLSIGDADTKNGDAKHFKDRVKMHLGDLSLTTTPVINGSDARLYLTVRASSLTSKVDMLAELMEELIYTARLDDADMIKRKLEQIYTASEEEITSDALSTCISRIFARYDQLSLLREKMNGYEFHRYLKDAVKSPEKIAPDIACLAEKMRNEYLTRGRLTLAVTSDSDGVECDTLLDVIRKGGSIPPPFRAELLPRENEAIAIPGTVGYVAYGSNMITELGEKHRGSISVLTSMLTYEHLWGEIRIKGGAYGTGFTTRGGSGGIGIYSYRDPSPMKTLDIFSNLCDIAKEITDGTDLVKYITSTVGAFDTVSTPRSQAGTENLYYLSGKPDDYSALVREEIISTDREELSRLVEIFKSLKESSTYCVAAPRSMLADEKNILEI